MAQSQPADGYMTTPAGDLHYDEDDEIYYDQSWPEGQELTTERGNSTSSPEGMPMPQSAPTGVVGSAQPCRLDEEGSTNLVALWAMLGILPTAQAPQKGWHGR